MNNNTKFKFEPFNTEDEFTDRLVTMKISGVVGTVTRDVAWHDYVDFCQNIVRTLTNQFYQPTLDDVLKNRKVFKEFETRVNEDIEQVSDFDSSLEYYTICSMFKTEIDEARVVYAEKERREREAHLLKIEKQKEEAEEKLKKEAAAKKKKEEDLRKQKEQLRQLKIEAAKLKKSILFSDKKSMDKATKLLREAGLI